jgi:hypothetical protein
MIDRIYFALPAGTLAKCSFLLFKHTVDDVTGELDKWKEAHWGAFKIRVHNVSGRIEVRGSLHKYWSKSHNGGPFPRWAVAQAVQRLASELLFKPEQAALHGIEYGANVPMLVPAKQLLSRVLLHTRKGCEPKALSSTYNRRGLMREVEAQQYYLKLYDKEAQIDDVSNDTTGGECLRVELKVCTMQQLKAIGVKTLADLANLAKLEAMGKILFGHWDSLVFAAPNVLPATVPVATRRLLEQAARVGYWDSFKGPRLRVQVRKYRKAFAVVAGEDEELNAATQGLRSTWQQLLHAPTPALSVATVGSPADTQLNPLCKDLTFERKETTAPAPSQTAEGLLASYAMPARLAADDEREPTTTADRRCQTCGRVLTSSSSRTKFCSEREWGATAKKCRNAASNPGHNARRTLLKIESQPLLFPIREFVRVPEQYRAFVLAAA